MFIEINNQVAPFVKHILSVEIHNFEELNSKGQYPSTIPDLDVYYGVRCLIDAIDEKIVDSL